MDYYNIELYLLLGFLSIYAFSFYIFLLTNSLLYSVISFLLLQITFIWYVVY